METEPKMGSLFHMKNVKDEPPPSYHWVIVYQKTEGTDEPCPYSLGRWENTRWQLIADDIGVWSDLWWDIDKDNITHWEYLPNGN